MEQNFSHTLFDLEVYQVAVIVGDMAWEIYQQLPRNFQYHIGNQFLDSADSVGANVAEGYGRYHYKDSINFNLYARGSAFETVHWITRLEKREQVEHEKAQLLRAKLELFIGKVNAYNSYLRKRYKNG